MNSSSRLVDRIVFFISNSMNSSSRLVDRIVFISRSWLCLPIASVTVCIYDTIYFNIFVTFLCLPFRAILIYRTIFPFSACCVKIISKMTCGASGGTLSITHFWVCMWWSNLEIILEKIRTKVHKKSADFVCGLGCCKSKPYVQLWLFGTGYQLYLLWCLHRGFCFCFWALWDWLFLHCVARNEPTVAHSSFKMQGLIR